MVHPQKRIFIKKTLECTITRICELKKDLVAFNPRGNSIYVHLDQLLFDLKYDPSIIEIPVPRYFKEDDRIFPEFDFKEKLDRGGKKPKKKKKKKSKKGGGDDEENVKKPEPMELKVKNKLMEQLMTVDKYNHPEVEVIQDTYDIQIDFLQAIRLIQKNDRGRQGRQRIMLIYQNLQASIQKVD
jgi:hypothetical protein